MENMLQLDYRGNDQQQYPWRAQPCRGSYSSSSTTPPCTPTLAGRAATMYYSEQHVFADAQYAACARGSTFDHCLPAAVLRMRACWRCCSKC
jgi:hypothetical protein